MLQVTHIHIHIYKCTAREKGKGRERESNQFEISVDNEVPNTCIGIPKKSSELKMICNS